MKLIRGYSVSVIILQTLFWSKLLFLTWKIHVMIDHLDWLFCAKFPIDADLNLSLYNYVYVCLFLMNCKAYFQLLPSRKLPNCLLQKLYEWHFAWKRRHSFTMRRSFQSAKKVSGRLEDMCTSFIASNRHIFNLQGKPTLPQVDFNTFLREG